MSCWSCDRARTSRRPRPRFPACANCCVRGAGLPGYPGLRFGLPARAQLEREWRAWRPDAVYVATEGPLGWSAVRAARALGIACATGFHTRFDDFAAHYGLGLLTPMVFAWLRRFHNLAGATLVPTRELKQFLDRSGFRDVRLLPRGVDTGQFAPARRDPRCGGPGASRTTSWRCSASAAWRPRRTSSSRSAATARSSAACPGRASSGSATVRRCPALKREHPDFVYCGMRRDADLARHFASTDLFLFPSLTETFGNVTLEALASGVPPGRLRLRGRARTRARRRARPHDRLRRRSRLRRRGGRARRRCRHAAAHAGRRQGGGRGRSRRKASRPTWRHCSRPWPRGGPRDGRRPARPGPATRGANCAGPWDSTAGAPGRR